MEINWYNLAEAAYDTYIKEISNGKIKSVFSDLRVNDQQAWIAAVKDACSLHSAACLV